MATIEKRARKHAQDFCECLTCGGAPHYCRCSKYKDAYENYIKIATEQDRIARAEERERCIKLAIKKHCQYCLENKTFEDCYNSDCDCCSEPYAIRNAMEGGEG